MLPGITYLKAVGIDLHAFKHRCGTGGNESPGSFLPELKAYKVLGAVEAVEWFRSQGDQDKKN